jgi:HD-like signal output (HDOD) protein
MTYESLVENIESLPPLSNAIFLIQQLYVGNSDDVDIHKLIRIIESDAILTANILKIINSSYYGFYAKITSVSQAVNLFGSQKIYGFVINYAVRENIKADTTVFGVNSSKFNIICHLQSSLLKEWYLEIDAKTASFLTPLAFIMELGKLVLALEITKSNYTNEFKHGYKECENTTEYEKALLDTTSYYLSGVLFEHWKLDKRYVEILKGLDFDDPNRLLKMQKYIDIINVIKTAINMKEVLTKKSVLNACKIVQKLGLDTDRFVKKALYLKQNYIANTRIR